MSYKDIILCESIALVAVLWLIYTVCFQMSYKNITLCESHITFVAMGWFISSLFVCLFVCQVENWALPTPTRFPDSRVQILSPPLWAIGIFFIQ